MSSRQRYTSQEKEIAYSAIALADGNCALASRELAAAGLSIPDTTLRHWRCEFPEEIEAARIKNAPFMEEKRIARLEAVATKAVDVTDRLLDRTLETSGELSPKDLPGALRNTAVAGAALIDKTQLLKQRPTSIVSHDYSAAIKGLERMGIVEGEAQEIPDAVEIKELEAA